MSGKSTRPAVGTWIGALASTASASLEGTMNVKLPRKQFPEDRLKFQRVEPPNILALAAHSITDLEVMDAKLYDYPGI